MYKTDPHFAFKKNYLTADYHSWYGIQSAWIITTELEDIHRFKNFDQLAGYVGFKPYIYSSGEHTVNKGITRQCNHLLRGTLVECAWMAIGKDPALTQAYYNYKKRMHYNKAIIRIAKNS